MRRGDMILQELQPGGGNSQTRIGQSTPGRHAGPGRDERNRQARDRIAWTSTDAQHEYRTEWIFDKATLQYIGERDYNVRTGVVNGESAILQRAFVDKAGRLP